MFLPTIVNLRHKINYTYTHIYSKKSVNYGANCLNCFFDPFVLVFVGDRSEDHRGGNQASKKSGNARREREKKGK